MRQRLNLTNIPLSTGKIREKITFPLTRYVLSDPLPPPPSENILCLHSENRSLPLSHYSFLGLGQEKGVKSNFLNLRIYKRKILLESTSF